MRQDRYTQEVRGVVPVKEVRQQTYTVISVCIIYQDNATERKKKGWYFDLQPAHLQLAQQPTAVGRLRLHNTLIVLNVLFIIEQQQNRST